MKVLLLLDTESSNLAGGKTQTLPTSRKEDQRKRPNVPRRVQTYEIKSKEWQMIAPFFDPDFDGDIYEQFVRYTLFQSFRNKKVSIELSILEDFSKEELIVFRNILHFYPIEISIKEDRMFLQWKLSMINEPKTIKGEYMIFQYTTRGEDFFFPHFRTNELAEDAPTNSLVRNCKTIKKSNVDLVFS